MRLWINQLLYASNNITIYHWSKCNITVLFGTLDLDLNFKLIDFKSINFRSYFKSKHFEDFKSLVNLSDRNPWHFLNGPNKIFGFQSPKFKSKCPNHVIQTHHYPYVIVDMENGYGTRILIWEVKPWIKKILLPI